MVSSFHHILQNLQRPVPGQFSSAIGQQIGFSPYVIATEKSKFSVVVQNTVIFSPPTAGKVICLPKEGVVKIPFASKAYPTVSSSSNRALQVPSILEVDGDKDPF